MSLFLYLRVRAIGLTARVFYLYTEFISFPIEVFSTKSVPKQVEDAEASAAATVSLFSFMCGQLV